MRLVKSILKWVIFGIAGLIVTGLILAAGKWAYDKYQNAEITVLAMECLWKKTSSGKLNHLEWYLFKKKRSSLLPDKLYRGSYLIPAMTDELTYKQWDLTDWDENFYYFNTDKSLKKTGHRINRKDLSTVFIDENGIKTSAKCKEIEEGYFYRKVKEKIEEKNREYKF